MPYKVILRRTSCPQGAMGVTWEPGCPILVETYQVSRDTENADAYLQARVRNLSNKRVDSFVARFTLVTTDGQEIAADCHPLDADINPGEAFDITPLPLERPDISEARVLVCLAATPETTWESTGEALPLPAPKPLSTELDPTLVNERDLQIAALINGADSEMAQRHMTSIHEGWWQCACGKINVDRESCWSCGAALAELELLDSVEHLGELVERRATDHDHRQASTKRVIRATSIIGGLIAVALIMMSLFNNFVAPKLKYDEALAYAEKGEYSTSYSALVALDDYSDAPARAQEVGRSAIRDALAADDFEEALDWCEVLGDEQRAREIKYQYVQSHLDNKDMTTHTYLTELKELGYRDAERLFESLYAWSFEFALCSRNAWSDGGEEWLETDTFGGEHGKFDSPLLLARAQGGEPGASKRLHLDFETIEKDTQIHSTGEWEGIRNKAFLSDCVEVKGDGSISTASAGSGLYWRAWRVTITDSENHEVLAVKTIYLDE